VGIGIWQTRDQAARKPVRGSRRGPAGGPNTIEVRERARGTGHRGKDRGRVPADPMARFKAAIG